MRTLIIDIEPHDELPDERTLIELLVEQLNEAVGPRGLHIGRVGWGDGTYDAIRFRLSGDVETRAVQFVLQLQTALNDLYYDMLAVEKDWLTVCGIPILPLNNLPFVYKSSGYRKIMEKVRQAEEKDYGMDSLLDDFLSGREPGDPKAGNTEETLRQESVNREMKALTDLGDKLTDAALVVAQMSRSTAGPRWKKAEELFWHGAHEAAMTVLTLPEIKKELRKAAREGDCATGESLIGEALLRLRLLRVDAPDDWKQEALSIYKTCVTCGRSCLPKMALVGLMTEYAHFLDDHLMELRSIRIYEEVLTMLREQVAEDPENALPSLVLTLRGYAQVLVYKSNRQEIYESEYIPSESYWYECDPSVESVFSEALEICRLLAAEDPDAALPLWVDTSFVYGGMLLRLCYAKRAMQAMSEAVEIYRLLVERYPKHYRPKLAHLEDMMSHQVLLYGHNVNDENASEEALDEMALAERGDPEAQYKMGERYQSGDGVCKDHEEALKWYLRAGENGNMEAQRVLGCNYRHSILGKSDLEEAVKWYRLAARQGDETSQVALAEICLERGDTQSYEEAFWWLREAADQESAEACLLLGKCYENGKGVRQDYLQAAAWYAKGDEIGNFECTLRLGVFYHHGKGVPQDYHKALECYQTVKYWSFIPVQSYIDELLRDTLEND